MTQSTNPFSRGYEPSEEGLAKARELASAGKKLHYKIVSGLESHCESEANKLGEEGWRLVQALFESEASGVGGGLASSPSLVLIFERET